jgi:hypothetical protein
MMKITRDDLFVQVSPDGPDLFEDWRWLIGSEAKPFLVSSVGDAFLHDSDGVNWLNVGDGTYTKVADSVADFQSMLAQPEKLDEWFIPQLVGDILATGLTRASHECFGFKQPPVLGGEYEPDNFETTDLSVHFSILGQIHRQVRDLPPGTPISEVKIK